jgi:hypothetical protein
MWVLGKLSEISWISLGNKNPTERAAGRINFLLTKLMNMRKHRLIADVESEGSEVWGEMQVLANFLQMRYL